MLSSILPLNMVPAIDVDRLPVEGPVVSATVPGPELETPTTVSICYAHDRRH